MIAPSGEQVEIELAAQRAVVVEVGGGLRTYEVGGLLSRMEGNLRPNRHGTRFRFP